MGLVSDQLWEVEMNDVKLNTVFPGSWLSKRRGRVHPSMSTIRIDQEVAQTISEIAAGVFADVVNEANTFESALSAIYLTGFLHAAELSKDIAHD